MINVYPKKMSYNNSYVGTWYRKNSNRFIFNVYLILITPYTRFYINTIKVTTLCFLKYNIKYKYKQYSLHTYYTFYNMNHVLIKKIE